MVKRTKKKQQLLRNKSTKADTNSDKNLSVRAHLNELKKRLLIIASVIILGSLLAYILQKQVIAILLKPSEGQHFIYTSPLGGINFLFSACLDIGIAISVPIIIYHLLKFSQPLMKSATHKFIVISSLTSGFVAIFGATFGYFIGLPSALHFLTHQFTSVQIQPLITIQSYMSFVAVYLLGSALMFQLPLILLLINRIKPLKPSGLLRHERLVIVLAVIIGFIMNPSPNLLAQLLVVGPLILMYQLGIVLIWIANHQNKPNKLDQLLERDSKLQQERAILANRLKPLFGPSTELSPVILSSTQPIQIKKSDN